MKTTLAAIGAALLMSTSALAYDDGPHYNWTGLYLGVHAGRATGDWDGVLSTTAGCPSACPDDASYSDPARSIGLSGFLGGVQLGYNWHVGGIVLGAEVDLSLGSIDGGDSFATDKNGPSVWDKAHTLELSYLATARAKIGVPVGRALLYATGGVAWAKTDADIAVSYYRPQDVGGTPYGISGASASEHHIGWTAGGGLEYALTPNISFKAEYLYVDLGEADYHFTGGTVFNIAGPANATPFDTDAFKSDITMHIVRVGVNARF